MVKQNDEEDQSCGFGLSMNSHLSKRPGAAAAQVQHPSVHKMQAQRLLGSLSPPQHRGQEWGNSEGCVNNAFPQSQHCSPATGWFCSQSLCPHPSPVSPALGSPKKQVPGMAAPQYPVCQGQERLSRTLAGSWGAGSAQPLLLRAALLLLHDASGPATTSGSAMEPRSIPHFSPTPCVGSVELLPTKGRAGPGARSCLSLQAKASPQLAHGSSQHSQAGCCLPTADPSLRPPWSRRPPQPTPPPHATSSLALCTITLIFRRLWWQHGCLNSQLAPAETWGPAPLLFLPPPRVPLVGAGPPPRLKKAARGTACLNIREGSCPQDPANSTRCPPML